MGNMLMMIVYPLITLYLFSLVFYLLTVDMIYYDFVTGIVVLRLLLGGGGLHADSLTIM